MALQVPRIVPLLVAALIAHTARAEILLPGASLAAKNPPSMAICVDETQLGARIRTQLSSRVARKTTLSSLQLNVTIRRTLTTLVADLRMTGRAGGTRQIEAARCKGLTEALAVTIAMMLDEDAEESRTKAATKLASASAGQAEAEVPPAAAPAAAASCGKAG